MLRSWIRSGILNCVGVQDGCHDALELGVLGRLLGDGGEVLVASWLELNLRHRLSIISQNRYLLILSSLTRWRDFLNLRIGNRLLIFRPFGRRFALGVHVFESFEANRATRRHFSILRAQKFTEYS